MSYSFSVTATNKAEAKQKIAENFDNIVNGQAPHAADREAVVAAGGAFVDILADPADGQEIYVGMSGSLSWTYEKPDAFTGVGVNVSAAVRAKQ